MPSRWPCSLRLAFQQIANVKVGSVCFLGKVSLSQLLGVLLALLPREPCLGALMCILLFHSSCLQRSHEGKQSKNPLFPQGGDLGEGREEGSANDQKSRRKPIWSQC